MDKSFTNSSIYDSEMWRRERLIYLRQRIEVYNKEYNVLFAKHQELCKHEWVFHRDTSLYPEHEWCCNNCRLATSQKPRNRKIS